ncbi:MULTISPECIES: N-acetylglucosamine kinase [Streptomyces]|uniref:N-acetylglucosamine kinase n=1 Tax=Streptomyces TaxID=1883 RepID=UPI000591716A|nr:BadF/BadG/BcrA/BcrD ATPase family protein [Streptomyces sp. SCSIO ZS0520]
MTGPGPRWVLGVDSGGSGLRAALAADDGSRSEPLRTSVPVRTAEAGIDAGHLLELLLPLSGALLERAGAGHLSAVAVGAAGMASLGDDLRAVLPAAVRREFGTERLVLAADAVTAYTGALGLGAGAVLAAGTGMVALGTDLTRWRRADGWGHLLGDCGGGAWIGRAGLEAAMRAHDGRRGGSPALLERAEAVFGPAPELPGKLYPRTDRPAALASFAPEVAACAAADSVSAAILDAAALHLAEAAAAVTPEEAPSERPHPEVALTGGLFRLGEPLLAPLRAHVAQLLPQVRLVPAAGDPLEGALRLGLGAAAGDLALPRDGRMLWVAGA